MCDEKNLPWVISSGDEGLQLNNGCRLGFAGSGYALPHFAAALAGLQKTLQDPIYLASTQEDDWLSEKLQSKNQALFDETLSTFAQEHQIPYVGQFDYGDPKDLSNGVRGHLVRPPKIHVAEHICLTCGGGEQTYSLQQFVICADYAQALETNQLREILTAQIDFYRRIIGKKLPITIDSDGPLSDEVKTANRQALEPLLSVWD